MADDILIRQIAGIVTSGTPIVLAALGETLAERAGVINLGVDGTLLLSAVSAFITALAVQKGLSGHMDAGLVTLIAALAGSLVAMLVGVIESLVVTISSIELKQSQVAIGFVLTLLGRDLAIFLGTPYRSQGGIPVLFLPIPLLKDIPLLGPILFQHDLFTYLSLIALIVMWFWIFRTKPGLTLRSVGERPATAFARGANVNRIRYIYTAIGGALIGLGGAAYTLSVNSTWDENAVGGNGWIALAIVIFGGWQPLRVVIGVYLVAALRVLVTSVQSSFDPALVGLMNAAPWLLMIITLFLVSGSYLERLLKILPRSVHPALRALLRSKPPAALGTPFEQG